MIGTIGFVLLVLAPIAELVGFPPLPILDQPLVRLAGVVVALAGIAGIVVGQATMGPSSLGDVDPEARTALVTSGPFRWVRNPILTASALTSLGVALMVPNLMALAMLVAIVTTYQVQVRLVEEPYLVTGPRRGVSGVHRADRAVRTLGWAPKAPIRVGTGGRLRPGARLPG